MVAPANLKLDTPVREIFKSLLVEIIEGEIQDETRLAIAHIPLSEIPEPYHHILGLVQGSGTGQGVGWDNKELARYLLDELRILCIELLENDP